MGGASAEDAREPAEGAWDEPFYRVHTEHFDAAFLPDADEDINAVDNVDVFVTLRDGSKWSATIFTVAVVEELLAKWAVSGEALGGRYFWCPDGLVVRDAGIGNMVQVLAGLVENGEFGRILQRIEP